MDVNYDVVVATFVEEDVIHQLDDSDDAAILEYVRENDLMRDVIYDAVIWLRDWYDWTAGDAVWDALWDSLNKNVGKEKLEELRYGDEE